MFESIRPDRREFLAGSAALVLGGSKTWTEKLAKAEAQGEPARVAVVGTGSRGSYLTRRLATIESAKVVAVCDNYPPHLEIGKEGAGEDALAFSDFGRMLRTVKPDAVVIATPLHTHFDLSMQALEEGCAVFCEKTMCYSSDQARRLENEVRRKKAVFQVGLQRRSNAVYTRAKELVDAGMLGEITSVKCQWHRNGSWRRAVPVEPTDASFPALERKLNWRLYDEYSRGLMTELASHQLDVVTWMTGLVPRSVIGDGGIDFYRDGREVYDNVYLIYNYERPGVNGAEPKDVRVMYSSIQTNAYSAASELIMGTKGTLFLTEGKGMFYREAAYRDSNDLPEQEGLQLVKSGRTLKVSNDPWAHRGEAVELNTEGDSTRNELVFFIDSVRKNDPNTVCTVKTGMINTASAMIGHHAMREGKRILNI